MLKLLGFVIKVTMFSLVVLLIGNLVHWHGRTISDQVRTGMSQVERQVTRNPELSGATKKIRHWSNELIADAREGSAAKIKTASGAQEGGSEVIPLSERQKLRALIRELNGSR